MKYSIPTLLALYQDANTHCDWTDSAKDCKLLHPRKGKRPSHPMDTTISSKKSKSTAHASSRSNKALNPRTASYSRPQHVNKTPSFEHSNADDPGFAQFLREHSSPRHQRVTAGGKIVPMKPNEKQSHPGELPTTEKFVPPPEMANVVQFISEMRQASMQAEEVLNEMSAQLHAFQPSHDSPQTPLYPQGDPYSLLPPMNPYETIPSSRPILSCISEDAPFGTVPNAPLYMGWGPIPDFGQAISHQPPQSLPIQMPLQAINTFLPEPTPTVFNELYSYISQSAAPVGNFMSGIYNGDAESLMNCSSITAALQQSVGGAPIGFWNWMGLVTNVVEHSMGDMERLFQAYNILTVHRANIQQMIINTSVNIAWTQITHPFQRDYRVMYINMRDMVDRALQIIEFLIEDSRNAASNQTLVVNGSTQEAYDKNKLHPQSHEDRQEENKELCMNHGTNTIASSSSCSTLNGLGNKLRRPRMIEPYTPRLLHRSSQANQLDGACSDVGTRHVEDDELWPNLYAQDGSKIQHNTIASVPEFLFKSCDNESDNIEAIRNHADEGVSALDSLFIGDCDKQERKNDSGHSLDRNLDNASLLSNRPAQSLLSGDINVTGKGSGNFEERPSISREPSVEIDAQSILHTDVQSIFWELNLSKHSFTSLQDPEAYDSEIEIGEGSLDESAIDVDQIDTLAQADQLEYETDTTVGSVSSDSDDWSICVNSTKYPTHAHKSEPTSDDTTVSRSSIYPGQLKPHERLSVATTFNLNHSSPIMPSFHGGKRSDSPYDNTPTKKKTKDLMVERVSEELEGCGSFFKGNLQLGWADQEQNPSTQQEIQQSIRHQILGALQNRVHIILARRDLSRRHLEQQQVEQHGTGQHRLHPPRQTNFTVQISITSACGKFTQGCSPDAKAILHKYSSSDENNSNEQAPM